MPFIGAWTNFILSYISVNLNSISHSCVNTSFWTMKHFVLSIIKLCILRTKFPERFQEIAQFYFSQGWISIRSDGFSDSWSPQGWEAGGTIWSVASSNQPRAIFSDSWSPQGWEAGGTIWSVASVAINKVQYSQNAGPRRGSKQAETFVPQPAAINLELYSRIVVAAGVRGRREPLLHSQQQSV